MHHSILTLTEQTTVIACLIPNKFLPFRKSSNSSSSKPFMVSV